MPLATIDTPVRTVRLDDLNIVTVQGTRTEVVDGNYVVSPRHVPIYPVIIDGNSVECSETEFALHFTEITTPIGLRYRGNITVFETDPDGVGWSQLFTRFTCDHCDREAFYNREAVHFWPTWCPSCEERMGSCEECGGIVHEEETRITDSDMTVCYPCYEQEQDRRNARRNRGHTEASQFFKAENEQQTFINDRPLLLENHVPYYTMRETTLYMGLELEIEMPESRGGCWDNIEELLDNSWGRERYDTKTDGSLSNGVEVVTQPHTLAAYEQLDWSVLTRIANLGCRSADTSTCGAHVHISRDSFTDLAHQYRFTQFITRNPYGVKEVAQRISDRWAAYTEAELTLKYLKKELSPQRYKAVNLCNEATLEIRAFKGSLKPERVRAYLQFVHSVHAYTKHLTVTDIRQGALQFSAYRAWLWQHALPTYNELRLYIREGN
jgi:hypothetical protein